MRIETKHTLVLFWGTAVTATLGLVYSVYAGRVLGLERNADFVAAVSLVLWGQIALGPINGTVARFTSRYAGADRRGKVRTLHREVARRVAMWGLVGGGVAALFLKPVGIALHFRSLLPLLVALGMLYVTLLLSVARGVLRGVQRFHSLNVNTMVEAGTRLAFGVLLLTVARDATLALGAYLFALIAALALSRWQLRSAWGEKPPEALNGDAIRRFGLPFLLLMFTSAGFQNLDMLVVKHWFDPSQAGEYGAAFNLARSIGVLVTPFTTLLLPLLACQHERKRHIVGIFLRVCSYFLALAALPLLLFALWPERIMVALYGGEFLGAAHVLAAVTGTKILTYLCHLLALGSAALGRFRFLYVYLPMLVVEATALTLRHGSLRSVIATVAVVLLVTLVALVGVIKRDLRRGLRQDL